MVSTSTKQLEVATKLAEECKKYKMEIQNGSTELKMDYQQQQQGGVGSGNYV
jgi:hypothetical protein